MARRRGHGEGSIHQRPDGRWCATLELGWIDGKRTRKYLYGETRKAVTAKLKAAHHTQADGVDLRSERVTVGQFLDRWLTEVVAQRNKPRTREAYTQIVRQHLKPALGHYPLAQLRPEHVQSFLNQRAASGLAHNTVRNLRATLRRALNQALRWQYVPRNVATLVDVPRASGGRGSGVDDSDASFHIQPLDEQQARALLNAVAGHRLEAVYRIALGLGLRRGEVLGLRWSDIDVAQATIQVSGALQRQRGRLERTTTKTRASAQAIAVPPVLLEAIARQRERQAAERQAAGDAWQEHGLVFTTPHGTPIEPRNLVRHFKGVLKRAGLPERTRFHDLRHSCATLLIAQGVHPRVVMEILRHSQISTTMNTYAHVLPRLQRDATARVEAVLTGEDHDAGATDGAART